MKMDSFVSKHISKINAGLTILYFVVGVLNGWWAYEEFQAQEYKDAVYSSFSAGMFGATFFFFAIIMSQLRLNWKLQNDKFRLMMDNHDLVEEILILKMPHLAKAIQDDSLGSQ